MHGLGANSLGEQVISYSEALERIIELISPLGEEYLRLEEAAGHVAAEDLDALEPVPPFANAAMDGFALQAADTAHASAETPVRMAVAGRIAAVITTGLLLATTRLRK